ncbi:MAG: hypothetical protein PWQ37_58 [Candidatus Petromonas sp.]|nr:hypothetical protein [Candidatus Petromonas sp.]
MMKTKEELQELTVLVNKFVDFARELKREGKIDEEQYQYLTKTKIEFLKETKENNYISKNLEVVENDLFY